MCGKLESWLCGGGDARVSWWWNIYTTCQVTPFRNTCHKFFFISALQRLTFIFLSLHGAARVYMVVNLLIDM